MKSSKFSKAVKKENMQMLLCMQSNDLRKWRKHYSTLFLHLSKRFNFVPSIFSGSGMTNHMFCIVADAKIDDLIIKVNKKESTT